MTQKYNIAVAGATGAVGTEIVQILEQRDFPIDNLFLLASSKSKGKKVEFREEELVVEDLNRAISFLDNITSKTTKDDVLDAVFSSFCVGK
mgnify:CR=1 FL=1